MNVWSGLGVNYAAGQAAWASDIAYFKSIGLVNVRVNLPTIPIPWAAGTPDYVTRNYASWRQCAITFAAAGFWVDWGPSFTTTNGTLTATTWPGYHDAVVAEAAYLQSQGTVLGTFEIGNELEGRIDGTTLTIAQCRANIRQLATDVKAVYTLAPISYGTFNPNSNYTGWASEGKGDIDYITVHVYPGVSTTQTYSYERPPAVSQFAIMTAAFGDACFISEFHLDGVASRINLLDVEQSVTAMRGLFGHVRARVLKAFIFTYGGVGNPNDDFAMKNMDGSFNPMWEVLERDNHRIANIPG